MADKKILIADDDGLVLGTLAQGLRNLGYEVIEATDGKEAVELALEQHPELAILDVRMPNMTGIEASEIIEHEIGIPILFLSAYNDTQLVESALDQGAMGYLVKPISVERLVPSIEAALRRSSDIKSLIRALQKSKKINRGVGIVMERYGVDETEGFAILRNLARSRRTKLETVANEIVKASAVLNELNPATKPDSKAS